MNIRVAALPGMLALAVAICGCPRATVAPTLAPAPDLVWPEPPSPPRIRYLKSVAEPADFGIRAGWWQRAAELFTGTEPRSMVRPVAVAAHGETLAVADPGLSAVHLFTSSSYRLLRQVEQQRFLSPVGVALTSDGELFIADSARAKILRVDTAGKHLGTIEDTELRRPAGVAWSDTEQRLYVSDALAHRILIYDREGRRLAAFGGRGVGSDGFNYPGFLADNKRGQILVSDALNFRVVALERDTGAVAWSFGAPGDGSGNLARPKGVAVDSDGHVYVADALFDTVQIFDREGRLLLAFGAAGAGPGQFVLPTGVCIDSDNRIYVADSYNRRVQIFQYLGSNGL